MFNYSSIKHLFSQTVSNSFTHLFLILVEYVCFIFPSTFQAVAKIHHYGHSLSSYNSSMPNVNVLFPIKYLHESNSLVSQVTTFGVLILALILYYITLVLGIPSHRCMRVPLTFLINFSDFFLFRYFSSFIIDLFIWFFVDFYQYKHIGLNIASIVFLVLFLFYFITAYYYIRNAAVLMNITNPLLVKGNKRYPYDYLSSYYQIFILFIKAIISIEYNYLNSIGKINTIVVCLNIFIALLSFTLVFTFTVVYVYFNFNCVSLYANFELICFRNGLSVFNGFLCLYTLFLWNCNIILVLFLTLNSALFFLYYGYIALSKNFLKRQVISYELLLLLIIHDANKTPLFNYKPIISSCFANHLGQCKQKQCAFCSNNNNHELNAYIDVFYKYLKQEVRKTHSFYEEIAKLLHYKMKMKSVKMFCLYYSLLRKYHKKSAANVLTLKIIVEDLLIKDNDDHSQSILKLIQISKLEESTRALITDMNAFFKEDSLIKSPETIIRLSQSIHDIIIEFKEVTVMRNCSAEQSNQLNESTKKTINGIISYAINLIRFIIQTLTNQDILGLSPIDIDHLDEFLYNHFYSDQILICSIDFKNAFFKMEVKLIKITGDLLRNNLEKKKILSDYFPHEIKEEGTERFNKQIFNNKSNEKDFVYPFQIKCVTSYIKYSFRLIQAIETNNLILFGQYSKEKKASLLLDPRDMSRVRVLSFCAELLFLIQFRKKWVAYLKGVNYSLYLQSIFKVVRYDKERRAIDCEFDYDQYLHSSAGLYLALRSSSEFKANAKNDTQLAESLDNLNKFAGYCAVVSLERIEKYSSSCKLYAFVLKTKSHSSILRKGLNEKELTTEGLNNNIGRCDTATEMNFHATTFQSSSFKKKTPKLSSVLLTGSQLTQYQMLNSTLKVKIEKETKRLALFSILLVCFNLVLIVICVIFLVTQVTKSANLSMLSDLYFQFKSMRLCFTNFINTLGATACYKQSPTDKMCVNSYGDYSEDFVLKNNLDPNLSLLDYSTEELGLKANYTQSVLNRIKQFLFSYHKSEFDLLLIDKMGYYEFEDTAAGVKMTKKAITFEEGLREYLNTIFILSESSYERVPLLFISYVNGEYLFGSRVLCPFSKHIYKGLVNYMNFFQSFDKGESYLMKGITQLKEENNQMNLIFMITLALLNAVLGAFCALNVFTAYHLFKILIINILSQLDKKQFLQMLIQKLNDLETLSKLYQKNPNDLIKKIAKYQSTPGLIDHTPSKKNERASYSPKPVPVSFSYQFTASLLGRIMLVLIGIFSLFFIVIIIFNSIISDTYAKLFKVFEYTSVYYNLEDSIYSNIALTAVSHFCNITNEDFAVLIGRTNPPEGILNDLIRATLNEVKTIAVYSQHKSQSYPSSSSFFNYTCDGMFYSFEDPFIRVVSDREGVDYRIISTTACHLFDSLVLEHFFFLHSDMVDRTHKLANRIEGRSYEDLVRFKTNKALYELFTISSFIFGPASFYYRSVVLLPTITKNFSNYVQLIGIYLGVNIMLEIFLFLIVKWIIIRRLELIRDNLYLFNNCVN